jgi:hypothetical protein
MSTGSIIRREDDIATQNAHIAAMRGIAEPFRKFCNTSEDVKFTDLYGRLTASKMKIQLMSNIYCK